MLQFTKTTIINNPCMVNDYDAEGNLKDRIYVADGLWKSDGTRGKKFVVRWCDELYVDEEHCPKLVGKQDYVDPVPATATVTLPTNANKIYRIVLYIRLRNNNSSMYSNQWTFKGKPFVIEFKGSDTAAEIAARIVKLSLLEYGKNLLKVTANGTTLKFTATDQWQMFMFQNGHDGVALEELKVLDYSYVSGIDGEQWVPTTDGTVVVDNGKEGFGDFAHIVKDLRLPTNANLRWQGPAAGDVFGGEPNDDKPLPGGHYTQYVIQYDSERGIQQQTALGGLATSRTTHVFFVESDAKDAFDAALTEAGITNKSTAVQSNRVNFSPESDDYATDLEVELQA